MRRGSVHEELKQLQMYTYQKQSKYMKQNLTELKLK